MKFSIQQTPVDQIKTAALIVGVFEKSKLSDSATIIDKASKGAIKSILKEDHQGKLGHVIVLRELTDVAANRIVIVGLGEQQKFSLKSLQRAQEAAVNELLKLSISEAVSTLTELDVATPEQRAQILATISNELLYQYSGSLSKASAPKAYSLKNIAFLAHKETQSQIQSGLKKGLAISLGANLAKDLGNLPGNYCTPTYLANQAKSLEKSHGLKVQVLDKKQIEALKMGAFLSVTKGSAEPPKFIIMEYSGTKSAKNKAPYVLVGKGLTFDAGGISLKPAANMDEMKYDMCGAASVIGTLLAVAELKLPINVVGIIPSCENLPSGTANKPGDVVTSMAGKTIEVLNTDAEGRLLLCDALTYVERYKPKAVIDIATLTGACIVALGHVNSGLFSTNDDLANELQTAADYSLDSAWRLPISEEYQQQLKSSFADIANIGGPAAGSVTAACFLARFTEKYNWAHLDIAGTAWNSGKNKGATGRPVALLTQYLINQA